MRAKAIVLSLWLICVAAAALAGDDGLQIRIQYQTEMQGHGSLRPFSMSRRRPPGRYYEKSCRRSCRDVQENP